MVCGAHGVSLSGDEGFIVRFHLDGVEFRWGDKVAQNLPTKWIKTGLKGHLDSVAG